MKAAVYDQQGDPSVLDYRDIPNPNVRPGEVLVEMQAVSIEGGDLINRRMSPPPGPGHVVGYASAGNVISVGAEVCTRRVGDRVVCFSSDGSHAALRAVPAVQTWLLPEGVHFTVAAAVPISFGTAHHCLFARGNLQSDETVLVQGGTGGVGLATIQLAKHAGAKVIAVASEASRLVRLTALGADHVIDHRTTDVAQAVLDLTKGAGVDLVVDPVGSTLETSLRALGPEGRLIFVGNAGGGDLTVSLWPALQANQSLLGVFMGTQFAKPVVFSKVDSVLSDIAAGKLEVLIDRQFSLSQAAEAHDHAERGKPFGRVVLLP
ncbi:NADPH:quinone reductase [Palleronia marisminoris]|uniref:Phthiocerol synthesis polyketide synthase type I PpsC n=1 Tax=Palleronia marisminoris TaxID=315423 RepID=A0A1Y5TY59_9RHOB|nr:zinc-binding dehydrogenase [Palleronia marisminoris]SFH53590.1 NADPH:quinone reductase [Palleronia marisminoris]SLN71339.1 Phthiocerol synthesis polyketide synthase type I PpsC [Palleronia marisminoris]